jgi:hypothetical protein
VLHVEKSPAGSNFGYYAAGRRERSSRSTRTSCS